MRFGSIMRQSRFLVLCIVFVLSAALSYPLASAAENSRETALTILGEHLTGMYSADENMVFLDFKDAHSQLTDKVPFLELVYERLFEYAPHPEPAYYPILALSYEESPYGEAGVSYKVTLRQDAYWHDGEPFTAKDVLCSFYMGFLSDWPVWKYIDSLSAPDDYTVIFNAKVKSQYVEKLILSGEVMSCPEHIYGEIADELAALTIERDEDGFVGEELRGKLNTIIESGNIVFTQNVVGTGIFKFENGNMWNTELVRNELSPFNADVKVDRINVTVLDGTFEEMTDDLEYDKQIFKEDFLGNYISEDSDGVIIADGALNPLFEPQKQIMLEVFPNLRVVELPGHKKISFKLNTNFYPFTEGMPRKAVQFASKPEEFSKFFEPYEFSWDNYRVGMPVNMRDEWLDEEFLSRLTKYDYNLDMVGKILSGIGYEKLDDGFYQDGNYDIPVLEILTYDATPFYAQYVGCAELISAWLDEAGLDAEVYATDRDSFDDSIKSGEWQIRLDITQYFDYPWEVYIPEEGEVILSDGTIVFLDTVVEQLRLIVGSTTLESELPEPEAMQMEVGERERLIKTLAVLNNDIAYEIPVGEVRSEFIVCGQDWVYPEDMSDWRYFGENMQPIARLLRTGALAPAGR